VIAGTMREKPGTMTFYIFIFNKEINNKKNQFFYENNIYINI
jgi:hypothetical protein